MYTLIFFIIFGVLSTDAVKKEYFSIQNEILIAGPTEGFLSLIDGGSRWPSFINYSQKIDNTTGIDVTVGFSRSNNSAYIDNYVIHRMDLCNVLDIAITQPESPQAQLMIPRLLGLYGIQCPIEKGKKNLIPYNFPNLCKIDDIGTGIKIFMMNIDNNKNNEIGLISVIASVDMYYQDDVIHHLNASSSSVNCEKLFVTSITLITLYLTY